MNPESDPDLRACFQAQRQAERDLAPPWRPSFLVTPSKAVRTASPRAIVWLPACAAAVIAACVFLALPKPPPAPRLSEALPVLLDAPALPLFAGLGADAGSPSDFLLPADLRTSLP